MFKLFGCERLSFLFFVRLFVVVLFVLFVVGL